MAYPTNSWPILPAAQCFFNKNKVTIQEIAKELGYQGKGTVVVCKKPNGQFHFIAGALGYYSDIGVMQKVHHDQTHVNIGTWEVVNEVYYNLTNVDGSAKLTFKVPPVAGENIVEKAGLHVFK